MTSTPFAGRILSVAAAFACLIAPVASSAASSKFGLEYRVERADTAKLSLGACMDTAKRESEALGYATTLDNRYPGQLSVLASGPAAGESSLIVYCIAVDQKTAFVVQAIDYNHPNSPQARKVADRVLGALKAAARR